MPNLDLSSATGIRLADTDILGLTMANRNIWQINENETQPLPGTLLARWPLQDSLEDISGNGRHGIGLIGGTSTSWEPTYVDGPVTGTRALAFLAGGNAARTVSWGREGLEPATLGFTFMAWFKGVYPASGRGAAIFVKARALDSTRGGAVLQGDGGNAIFIVRRWRDWLTYNDCGLNVSEWHHIAVVDVDNEQRVYIDGVEILGGIRSPDTSAWNTSWENYPWSTGWSEATLAKAVGELYVSNLRMFHGALTQAEVQEAMHVYD